MTRQRTFLELAETVAHTMASLMEQAGYSEDDVNTVFSAFSRLNTFVTSTDHSDEDKRAVLGSFYSRLKAKDATPATQGGVLSWFDFSGDAADATPPESEIDFITAGLIKSYQDAQLTLQADENLDFKGTYRQVHDEALQRLNTQTKSILDMLTEKAEQAAARISDFDYTKYDEYMRTAGTMLIDGSEARLKAPGSYFGNVDKSIRQVAEEVYLSEKSTLDLEQIAELTLNLGIAFYSSVGSAMLFSCLGFEVLCGLSCLAAIGSAAGFLLASGVMAGQIITGGMLYALSYGIQGLDMAMPIIDIVVCQGVGHVLKSLGEYLEDKPQMEQTLQVAESSDELESSDQSQSGIIPDLDVPAADHHALGGLRQ